MNVIERMCEQWNSGTLNKDKKNIYLNKEDYNEWTSIWKDWNDVRIKVFGAPDLSIRGYNFRGYRVKENNDYAQA